MVLGGGIAMNKKEKRTVRSVWSIIISTYGVFFRKMTGKCLFLLFLSLFPALMIPIKVVLERYLYDYADQVYQTGTFSDHAWMIFGGVFLIQIVYIGLYSVYRSNINYIGSDLEIILQNQINKKTAGMPLLAFEQAELYKKIELACSVSRDLRFMIMMFASELFVYAVSFISVSGVLGSYHYALVLMGVLAVFPDIITKIIQANVQYRALERLQEANRRKNYFQNLLTHLDRNKEIRVCKTKDFFVKKWKARKEESNIERGRLAAHNRKTDLICSLFSFFSMAASLLLVIGLVWKGKIGVGEFAASLSAVVILKSNFLRILNLGIFAFQCGLKGRYYYEVMDETERTGEETAISASKGITMKEVSFGYQPDRQIFDRLNVSLKPGQTVAIVGENGSGKSTLSKLLLGLYLPQKGDILYGDRSILGVAETSLYRESSAVFQNYGKYYFSIEENVRIGDSGAAADREKIKELLKLLEFRINQDGQDGISLATELGAEFGGTELSGGNWQKLAIARGLYRDHGLIVFDEPTSALDPLIEEKIYNTILTYKTGIIKVYVTHRMSTTASADLILVVDHGAIVESGTHQELMACGGKYAALWKTQAKWYRDV